MSGEFIIVVLVMVIIIMVVAGLYYMFSGSSKKKEDDVDISPDANVVQARLAVVGKRVALVAELTDEQLYANGIPSVQSLIVEQDEEEEPNELELLLQGKLSDDKAQALMYRMREAGYTITSPNFDPERGKRLSEEEDKSANEGSEKEDGGDEDNGGQDGGDGNDGIDVGAYEKPDSDVSEGVVDPITGISIPEERLDAPGHEVPSPAKAEPAKPVVPPAKVETPVQEQKEVNKPALQSRVPGVDIKWTDPKTLEVKPSDGEAYVLKVQFDRNSEENAEQIVDLMVFIAENFRKDLIAPELAAIAEKRFNVLIDRALWTDVKSLRANERMNGYERFGLMDFSLEKWNDYARESVETRRELVEKGEDGDLVDDAPLGGQSARIDFAALIAGNTGGKFDGLWDRLKAANV